MKALIQRIKKDTKCYKSAGDLQHFYCESI